MEARATPRSTYYITTPRGRVPRATGIRTAIAPDSDDESHLEARATPWSTYYHTTPRGRVPRATDAPVRREPDLQELAARGSRRHNIGQALQGINELVAHANVVSGKVANLVQ